VALFGILTSVIGRALLNTLFWSSGDADDDAQRAAARRRREAQRRRVAERVHLAGQQIGERIEQAIAAAGPLPAPLSDASVASSHRSPLKRLVVAGLLNSSDRLFIYTQAFIALAIFVSVGAIVLESVDWVVALYGDALHALETIVVAVFTVEYVAQIYVAEDRRRYIFSFWGIVDLLSILPSIVGLFGVTGIKVIRTLRVLRVLRILKLSKLAALNAQRTVTKQTSTFWLDLQIYLIALFTAMIMSATLVWFAEHDVNPMFPNIPEGLWFAIVTLTTTGSGAPVPVTIFGKLVAAGTMLTGLALFGVLASVIGRAMLTSLFGANADDLDVDAA
jgi:voltage-gated potassium channel